MTKEKELAGIRQLANQTIWYGLSNIVGRFINYLLTPILTFIYASADYGDISILFATAAFLNIVFTYGMETSYFRFTQKEEQQKVFNTTFSMLLITTTALLVLLLSPIQYIADTMNLGEHPEWLVYVVLIVALDTFAVIPFSKLRQDGKPKKFAAIKLLNILINMFFVIFFLYFCKEDYESGKQSFFASLYNPNIGIGYVFIANLIASAATLLMLVKEFTGFQVNLDKKLLKEIFIYSTPLIIVGFGGIINETIDRFMIVYHFNGTAEEARSANGIYSANYKLAVLIVLFIQTFRMGAEPFFFKQANKDNAGETYAKIMHFFIIVCSLCFLGVVLFLDIWKHFMGINKHPEYLQGLFIVPILMLAKIFLGIYYNLSVWYKLTNKTMTGAIITLIGAILTILVNYLLIPYLGYLACAIATVVCYGSMMVISFIQGQKHYPIPYDIKNGFLYIAIAVLFFGIHYSLRMANTELYLLHPIGITLLLAYGWIVVKREKKELINIPVLKKLYK
ncbi:MAG: lipopolysaccharide biosynthesis protein [Chitinophagaceae bacterium]